MGNINELLQHMYDWEGKIIYSQGNRTVTGYGDCSAEVYRGMARGGFINLPNWQSYGVSGYWTGSLINRDLPQYAVRIKRSECKKGDIFIWHDGADDAHTGFFLDNGNIIHCTPPTTMRGAYPDRWNSNHNMSFWRLKNRDDEGSKTVIDITIDENTEAKKGGNGIPTGILKLKNIKQFKEKTLNSDFKINNVFDEISKKYNIKKSDIPYQILSSEFLTIDLFDGYGNSYSYNPIYFEFDKTYPVIVKSSISDYYLNYYTFKGYREIEENYGIMDKTDRNITVTTDKSVEFLQANKNQIKAQQQSRNENSEMLGRQNALANQSNELNYRQTMTANSLQSQGLALQQKQNMYSGVMGAIGGIGSMLTGNIIGGAMGLIGTGANYYFNTQQNQLAQAQNQANSMFAGERNSLTSQSIALQYMQGKNSLNQAIRAYNAGVKDIENQPNTVKNMGGDFNFQQGNNLDNLKVRYNFANKKQFINALTYMKQFGITVNEYSNDIDLKYKQDFNYIKMGTIEIQTIDLNSEYLESIKNIYMTGTRVWSYKKNERDKFYNNYLRLHRVENPDVEGSTIIVN